MKISLSLRTKAIIGFAAFLVVLSAVSIDTLIQYGKLRSQLVETKRESDIVLDLSNEIRFLVSDELIDTQKYLLRFDQNPPDELQQLSREVYDRQVRYLKLPLNREERFQLERIKVLNSRVEEQLMIAVYLHALGQQDDARNQMLKAAPLVDELQSELHKLMILERERYNQLASQSQATSVFLSRRIVIIALAMGVLGLGLTLLIIQRIIQPIHELGIAAKKVGKGQLGVKVAVKHSDEMGMLASSFNEMSQSLKNSHHQLELKNHQLKSALDEKEDFLRAVSHDLGAPLRNISGLAASIESKLGAAITPEARTRLERIRVNADRELDLIGQLLELSRIKQQQGRVEAVNVEEIVTVVLENLSYQIEQKHIRIHGPRIWPLIVADGSRIKQIFQNLVENAIKYMGNSPSPTVWLGWEKDDQTYQFYVRDNGSGIKTEDQQTIFYVFRRGSNSDADGKGIGLATVKSIVETYGGEVWVHSEPGAGSTFYFTLNVSPGEESELVGELTYAAE